MYSVGRHIPRVPVSSAASGPQTFRQGVHTDQRQQFVHLFVFDRNSVRFRPPVRVDQGEVRYVLDLRSNVVRDQLSIRSMAIRFPPGQGTAIADAVFTKVQMYSSPFWKNDHVRFTGTAYCRVITVPDSLVVTTSLSP